jgi:hypothetical protein
MSDQTIFGLPVVEVDTLPAGVNAIVSTSFYTWPPRRPDESERTYLERMVNEGRIVVLSEGVGDA